LDHDGNFIVVNERDSDHLQLFDDQGNLIRSFTLPCGGSFNYRGAIVDNLNNFIFVDSSSGIFFVIDQQGNIIRSFGESESKKGEFFCPRGIAIDRHNNIVFCDSGNHKIRVIDQEGKLIRSFGTHGSNDGEFVRPLQVVINQDNNFVIADYYNNRIQIFSEDGKHLKSFLDDFFHRIDPLEWKSFDLDNEWYRGMIFSHPRAVALDCQDNIVVCSEKMFGCITIYDSQGNYINSFGRRERAMLKNGDNQIFDAPMSLVVDHQNNIIVADLSSSKGVKIF